MKVNEIMDFSISKLKEKWIKFWQPEQDWDIDICITQTTRSSLVHRIVDLYINKALELNRQDTAEKMFYYYENIQNYSCNMLDFDYLNELTMYRIDSLEDLNKLGDILYSILDKIENSPRRDEKEEVFNPKKEDFDINQNCLIHIIQERRERFPESIRSQSDSKIAGQIMNALERGIKMQRRDRSFAKASYSGKSGTISWFMPLHIDAPLSEDPELVMVVRRSGDFYEIKTILSYDDELKDRITALSLYSKLW